MACLLLLLAVLLLSVRGNSRFTFDVAHTLKVTSSTVAAFIVLCWAAFHIFVHFLATISALHFLDILFVAGDTGDLLLAGGECLL